MSTNQSSQIASDPPASQKPAPKAPPPRPQQALSRNALPENRESREQESRANTGRDQDYYGDQWDEVPLNFPTQHLPARPGFVQRFIRTSYLGHDDPSNIMKAIAEGWKPRDPGTVPSEFFAACNSVSLNGRSISVIGNHDMILMERPLRIQEHFDSMRDQYQQSLEGLIGEMIEGDGGKELRRLKGKGGTAEMEHSIRRTPFIADD